MNRRSFIKLCGVIAGSLALPVLPCQSSISSCAVLSNLYDPMDAYVRAYTKAATTRCDKVILSYFTELDIQGIDND